MDRSVRKTEETATDGRQSKEDARIGNSNLEFSFRHTKVGGEPVSSGLGPPRAQSKNKTSLCLFSSDVNRFTVFEFFFFFCVRCDGCVD